MYRIRFAQYYVSQNIKCGEKDCTRVYSNDMNEIYLFLKQHNFDPRQTFIENIPEDIAEDDYLDDNILKPFRMKSNVDKSIHIIMTTKHLIDLAVSYITEQLGDFLLFGETILRNDVQLIHVIRQILESIPCTTILDFNLLDGDSLNYACNTDWMYVKKTIDQITDNPSYDGQDLSELWDMINKECDYEVLPITLEGYVETFVHIILNKYTGNLDEDYAWR